MNMILNFLVIVLGGMVLFTIIGLIGFKVKAKIQVPSLGEPQASSFQPIPTGLPAPLQRYLQQRYGDRMLIPASLAAWGNGTVIAASFPRLGKLWVPIRWNLFLKPGSEFVWRYTITWYTTPFMRAGEEFRQGRGRFVVGNRILRSPNVNQSEHTPLWLYTLQFALPAAVLDASVTWQALDDQQVKMILPLPNGAPLEFVLYFNEDCSKLLQVKTERTANRTGVRQPFTVVFGEPAEFPGASILPASMQAAWGDDEIFMKPKVHGVCYGAEIDLPLEQGADEFNHVSSQELAEQVKADEQKAASAALPEVGISADEETLDAAEEEAPERNSPE